VLYILYGPDDYSRNKALEEIRKGYDDEATGGVNVITLDGEATSINDFKIACETIPFLSDKRLVIVKGLLNRFETKIKQIPGKKAARGSEQTKDYQSFAECIKNIPASTTLVMVDGEIGEKTPFLKEIAHGAEVKKFVLLGFKELPSWIHKRVTEAGGNISATAIDLLAKLVGNDLWTMANEIDKLVLYTAGRTIEERDVKSIVTSARETGVFTLVDAIMEGRTSAAGELMQQLLQQGAAPTYLISMLSRQIRLAILMKELTAQHKTGAEIQSALGLADYPMQKTTQQANKYTLEQLKNFYEKLLETDMAIKTGKYEDDLAMSILIVELCQR